jgi:hypothetical protein
MMMSARDHVKAQYRLGLRRYCVFRCRGENSLQRGIPNLDANGKVAEVLANTGQVGP